MEAMQRFTFQDSERGYRAVLSFGFLLLTGIILVSLLVTPFHAGHGTICIFKNILSIPCPGCGMTRAFLFLGHGDIYEAARLNILSPLVFSVIILLWLCSAAKIFIGKVLIVRLSQREKVLIYILTGGLIITGWAYNLFLNPYL